MRLLVVEDDNALSAQLRCDLERAGFAVDLAANGIDGEALGDIEPYDAVVLDLGLPGRPGLEVLANWRRRSNAVPVVVLTARDAWHEKVEGFRAGADDYLAKPFHTEELVARLLAVTRRATTLVTGTLQAPGLTLDEQRQTVTDAGGTVHPLTGTEFRLLRYFMLHPGQLLSKSRLTEHVYDNDSDKDSNVIEVYVNRLRQKLGKGIIATHRGQGYMFGERG
ncbi:MAG: DNA-binding response regulator [Gammaproteobacteria bacterium HGW-Gammaproteobacteria-1]|jgi:DNA-binding response OmpR family regulator|nr:MAG: DNA-binding response regulator [Gammaproteobacteria bacterium HGW-Gammaproteobacteria-1]